MATMSITSNDGALDSASAVLEVTATNPEYNQPALLIKQASKRGVQPRSGSMTLIPISNSLRRIRIRVIQRRGSMRLPFNQTSSRSMAATPVIPASKRSSYFSGKPRVAISGFGQEASLAAGRV
jgi:hypothetical protein